MPCWKNRAIIFYRLPDLKILLDENLDWRLQRDLPGHEVESVPLLGWAGIQNGALLKRAEDQFDLLITMDNNLSWQQNIAQYDLAVITLKASSNRLADTRPLMPKLLALLPEINKGQLVVLSAD